MSAPTPAASNPAASPPAGLVLASRGDALTPYLFEVLQQRYPVLGRLDPDLRPAQRALVAAATFRPRRTSWAEQFWKSGLGYRMRTANATAARRRLGATGAPVFQVHALFEVPGAPAMLYVDCTHRQSAANWPAWNPLHGTALARWYDRETRAYLAAEHLFAFSLATRDSLVGEYGVPADRVSVVWAGVNSSALPAAAAARPAQAGAPGAPGAAPVLLFVGNDFDRKGGPDLLAAFALVRAQVPAARLLLVGTRPEIAPQPGVEVLGRLYDRAEVLRLYAGADLFVLPSVFDPLPLVMLEAMAYGVPVVTTTSCGIPDVLRAGRDGTIVPARDPAALARALLDLLDHPDRARAMADSARERVAAEFTWDRVVDRMAPALDRALARAANPSAR